MLLCFCKYITHSIPYSLSVFFPSMFDFLVMFFFWVGHSISQVLTVSVVYLGTWRTRQLFRECRRKQWKPMMKGLMGYRTLTFTSKEKARGLRHSQVLNHPKLSRVSSSVCWLDSRLEFKTTLPTQTVLKLKHVSYNVFREEAFSHSQPWPKFAEWYTFLYEQWHWFLFGFIYKSWKTYHRTQ